MTNLEISENIYQSWKSGKPCAPVKNHMEEISLENAYKIQQLVTQKRLSNGTKIVGRKVGLTSFSVQEQLGVHQPDFGSLFTEMQYQNSSEVSLQTLIQPKAEAEIAVILNKSINEKINSIENIFPYIKHVLPTIEIVDSRIENWNISVYDTIADNASSGLFVVGTEKILPKNVDWENCSMQMFSNGKVVSEGIGKNCLDHPLNALLWLANTMIDLQTPLQQGEIILTGALGPMHTLKEPQKIEANITTVGNVAVEFI